MVFHTLQGFLDFLIFFFGHVNSLRRWLSSRSQTEMCVLDNTAQGLGQGKKQAHFEDSWHGA
jgi:hypothetical protein